jgi:lysophospholipase L1-like esterase
MVRAYSAGKLPQHYAPAGLWGTPWATIDGGRLQKSFFKAGGNYVPTWGSFNPAALENGLFMAVEFVGPRGLSVLGVGDSLTLGQTTTAWANSFGHQACTALSTPSLPVYWANYGYGGQTSPVFFARAKLLIDDLRPDVLIIPSWSPNDAFSAANLTLSLAAAVMLADYAIRKGVVPIITTPMPNNTLNTASDAIRLDLRDRVLALAGSYIIADFDAVVSDNATPARLLTAYDSGDHLHPNDAGHAALATQAIIPALRKVMAARARG